VAGIADLLDGGVAALFVLAAGHRINLQRTVRALAQDTACTLHGMRIVTIEAGGLPDAQITRELAQVRGGILVALVTDHRVSVRGTDPTLLVVTTQTDDIGILVEAAVERRLLLEAIDAQEFDVLAGYVGTYMRVVAGDALDLRTGPGRVAFERQEGALRQGRAASRDALPQLWDLGGIVQFTVARRLCAVECEGDRMVVGEVDSEAARKPGIAAEPLRDRPGIDGTGTGHADLRVLLPVEDVDGPQGDGAVVTRQAQFGLTTGIAQICRVQRRPGHRVAVVKRVGRTGELTVPQRCLLFRGRAMGCMAEGADLRFGGRMCGPRHHRRIRDYGGGKIVLGIADVGDRRRDHGVDTDHQGYGKNPVRVLQLTPHAPPKN